MNYSGYIILSEEQAKNPYGGTQQTIRAGILQSLASVQLWASTLRLRLCCSKRPKGVKSP
jgi:hypothetical protein